MNRTALKVQTNSLLDKSAWSGKRTRVGNLPRGQSLVEFAMIVPVMLLLLVGAIEIGRFAHYSILVSNAARAGAQYGALSLATAGDKNGIVNAALADGQSVQGLTIDTPAELCGCSAAIVGGTPPGTTCPATCTPPDHGLVYVQVTANGTFPSLFKYPGIPKSFTVSSTEKMRVAQ
jgi:Flp pilus assembly protein TadG